MIQLGEKSDGCTMKVNETLSRMTLDVIGESVYSKFVSGIEFMFVGCSCFRLPLRSPQRQ
jgi:hypothetical protein